MVQIQPDLEFSPDDDESVIEDHMMLAAQELGVPFEDVCFRHKPHIVKIPNDEVRTDFMYAEHGFLGDSICLTQADGSKVRAKQMPFTLENGLVITYGEITGLAGDFYGTKNPICDGEGMDGKCQRFVDAYNTLAQNQPSQPDEARKILKAMRKEVDLLNNAIQNHQTPSQAYSKLRDRTLEFISLTDHRPKGQPGYWGLALINWDHWGTDARTAYNASHTAALREAAKGTPDALLKAYSMNAFADHFLEDSFSAGHLRGPRRKLCKGLQPLCILKMHDEDNAIGLKVSDTSGATWNMYGDKRMFDPENAENLRRCGLAVQISADEVYEAWKSKSSSRQPRDFGAWDLACTIESARGHQELAPLFLFDSGCRRENVKKRRVWKFKEMDDRSSYSALLLEIELSGMWKYPMKLERKP